MKQSRNKQPATILSILIFCIATMLSGNAIAADMSPKRVTQSEFNAAIDTLNSEISDITPPARAIGDVLPDNSIVFWVDDMGQHGLTAQPFDEGDLFNWYVAKEVAENHGAGWRLPTKYELTLLFQQRDVVGGFAGGTYWSSTDVNADLAWYHWFGDNYQDNNHKDSTNYSVRAVRAF